MVLSRKQLCALIVILERKKKKKRAYWVKDWLKKRQSLCHMTLIKELQVSENNQDFKNYLRMSDECFQKLLYLVTPLIRKKTTRMRSPISAEERLAATLRFLATGRSFEDMKFTTLISPQALGVIIPETCRAIYKVLKHDYLKFPKTTQEWLQTARDFQNRWNFPNCGGAVDGKHIRITKPENSGSFFYNYKNYFSIVLMAIVNADYEFIYANVGCNGRVSDGGVIGTTNFYNKLREDKLNLPRTSETVENLNFVFIADDAFALQENLIKPYPHKNLSAEQRIFNYRLSRARRTVENAFGILANRFRIYHTEINLKPEKIDDIVLATCVLHNYLRRHSKSNYMPSNSLDMEDLDTGNIAHGEWRQQETLDGLQPSSVRNVPQNAKDCRERYKNYFLDKGKVSWQDKFL